MKKGLLLLTILFIQVSYAQVNRSYDGTENNISNPNWGAAQEHIRNYVRNGFGDLISEPGGQGRENPRAISNVLGSQSEFTPNELELSDFVWSWGQFIDHDINANADNSDEVHNFLVPECDPEFDPLCTGVVEIRMFRSKYDPATGTDINNPRKHINEVTSFIDGSGVYGSDESRANWLRTFTDGKLKTSNGDFLPWNTIDGEFESAIDPTAPGMALDGYPIPEKYFIGGDIRVNEQPGLTCFHTLWVREHNRICDELNITYPTWTDEVTYQRARKITSALIEAITYEEFLPSMGINLDSYTGYDSSVDPNILNVFSASGYRFGHSMVNGRLVRFNEDGTDWGFGAIDLRDAYFNPLILKDEGGISPFFRGLAAQEHQMVDILIMDDMRNFLFGPPGAGGIDLLAVNVERGRERGLPDYNSVREDLSLTPHTDFNDLTSDPDLRNALSTMYGGNIDDVDSWIGFMSEDHGSNTIMGEGLETVMGLQFEFLRDGDRYYYENDPAFTSQQVTVIKNTKLSEVILRNSLIETIQENVFIAEPRGPLAVEYFPFSDLKNINLTAYPNPVQKYFQLQVETKEPSQATLSIYGLNSELVSQEKLQLNSGKNEFKFELSDALANGVYVITLTSDSGSGQLKIIKQ